MISPVDGLMFVALQQCRLSITPITDVLLHQNCVFELGTESNLKPGNEAILRTTQYRYEAV